MKLKAWFLNAATVGQAAVARFAEVDLEDVREVVDELGYGARLTLAQAEEVVASLDGEEVDEDDEADDGDEASEDDAEEADGGEEP